MDKYDECIDPIRDWNNFYKKKNNNIKINKKKNLNIINHIKIIKNKYIVDKYDECIDPIR